MGKRSVNAVLVTELEKKEKRQTFQNVNPEAEDRTITEVLQLISTLQKGTVKEKQKVETTVLED